MKNRRSAPLVLVMLVVALCAAALAPANCAFAQGMKLDSLEQALAKHRGDDSVKVNLQLAIARAVLNAKPKRALELADLSLKIAGTIGFTRGTAHAHIIRGATLEMMSRWPEAKEAYERGRDIAERLADGPFLTLALSGLGTLSYKSGRYDEARVFQEKTLKLAESICDSTGIARALGNLANVELKRGNSTEAIRMFRRVAGMFEARREWQLYATVMANLGRVYQDRGLPDSAASYFRRSLDMQERIGDRAGAAGSNNSLGIYHYNQGRYDSARVLFRRSLALSVSVSNEKLAAQAMLNLGNVFSQTGESDSALAWYRRSYSAAERIGDTRGCALALDHLGTLSLNRGDTLGAIDAHLRAYAIAERLQDQRQLGYTSFQLAGTLRKLGRPDSAMKYYGTALELAGKTGNDQHKANVLNGIADSYAGIAKYEAALTALRESNAIYERLKNSRGMCATWMDLGRVHTNMGRYSDALEALDRSLSIAKEIGYRIGEADALKHVGNVHALRGDHDRALDVYARALDLGRAVQNMAAVGDALGGIGNVHLARKEYDKALAATRELIPFYSARGNRAGLAMAWMNHGIAFRETGKFDSARIAFEKALELNEQIGRAGGVGACAGNLGVLYLEIGNTAEAVRRLEQAAAIAEQTGEKSDLRFAFEMLAHARAIRGEYAAAYDAHKKYSAVQDSMLNESNVRSMNEWIVKYDVAKRDYMISLLEKEKLLQAADLSRSKEELQRRSLEAMVREQKINLMARESEIRSLELAGTTAELGRQRAESARKAGELALMTQVKDTQASLLGKERIIRWAVSAGFIVFVVLGVFVYRRIQDKRQTEKLRAESAELKARAALLQAQAAEAQSLALAAETERREKESQQQFSQKLIQSQEAERKRIAGDLHDGVGQELLIIKNSALLALKDEALPLKTQRFIEQIANTSAEALTDIRRLTRDLRPFQLDRFGITEALVSMLDSVRGASPISFTCEVADIDGLLFKDEEINVYRLVQESVNNIIKHSGATAATVFVGRRNGEVEVRVTDDGRGMSAAASDGTLAAGFGMHRMKERVAILGGRMAVESNDGSGTAISIMLPVQQSVPVEASESE